VRAWNLSRRMMTLALRLTHANGLCSRSKAELRQFGSPFYCCNLHQSNITARESLTASPPHCSGQSLPRGVTLPTQRHHGVPAPQWHSQPSCRHLHSPHAVPRAYATDAPQYGAAMPALNRMNGTGNNQLAPMTAPVLPVIPTAYRGGLATLVAEIAAADEQLQSIFQPGKVMPKVRQQAVTCMASLEMWISL